MKEVALGTQGTTTWTRGWDTVPGPGCPLLSQASVVTSVSLCLLAPQSRPQPGPPSLALPPSYHPPLGPGDVGLESEPAPNLDLDLLSRAGASPLAERRGKSSQESLALGLWPRRRASHRDRGRKGRHPTASCRVSHFSLPIPKTQLSVHPPGQWGAPGTSARSCRRPSPQPHGPMQSFAPAGPL